MYDMQQLIMLYYILIITSNVAPGSADTVCPRPSVTLTLDRLTLKLVSESHLPWGTFIPKLGMLGLWVHYVRDGQTDRRTDERTYRRMDKSNDYCPFPTVRDIIMLYHLRNQL